MNCSDHYQDLWLYLEQTENELSQAFEKEARSNHLELPTIKKNNLGTTSEDSKADIEDIELNLEFLINLNETIKSDISELLAKNEHIHSETNNLNCFHTNICNDINGYTYVNSLYKNGLVETDILSDTIDTDSIENSLIFSDNITINAATQTSPSLSLSSTNLTWASECSSSPCLTSASDSDILDDDAQSTSSTDTRDHLSTREAPKQRWQQMLSAKSSSAPVLKKIPPKVNKQCRSQSDRHLAEIEAAEACKWLRATGFPQYAQMYEDMQFPIDVSTAAQDHPFLEADVLHSLFRRLQILNSCAHLHQQRITHTDDSEDEYCALSNNWTYQSDIKRWSRTCSKPPLHKENVEDADRLAGNVSQQNDDIFEQCTQSPKERLRRAGSTKFRRRRDGVFFNEKENVLDTISQQLCNIRSCEINHVSDSEITPKHQRRSRTKSFDKTDSWSHLATTSDHAIWHKLPGQDIFPTVSEKKIEITGPSRSNLSATQLQVLKKLALLKLTAHMEKYCPSHRSGWNWDLPKFIRKIKAPVYKDKNVFGVPLTLTLQRTGQVLPRNIEEALRWLQQNAADHVGIFRKPGVKSRIQALRNTVEYNTCVNFTEQQCYDIADMVKQYFRELPETLLTSKMSETFILIFQYFPPYLQSESVVCALLLMPDENLEVLQTLLYFLLAIAKYSPVNQMNESNLAMCFAPSLFHYSQAYKQSVGTPHPKELAENKAAHDCLLYFLQNFNSLFRIPQEFLNQCKTSEINEIKTKLLSELGKEIGGWKEYLNECEMNLLKEVREKHRGWILINSHNPRVEISFKKVADGIPLRLWKVVAEIEAPPSEVLHRLLRERYIWDPELISAKIIANLDKKTEVIQFVRKNVVPLPNKEYCIVRTWRTDLPKDACLIVETSIEHADAIQLPYTVRSVVLASRYLIEPCGSGKSRLIHLSRVDTMARTPEWYQKNFGHLEALFLENIQKSFYQNTIGPESKV